MKKGLGENLIFLLSMPRAGSTMLSLALSNHPAVECPPEPWLQLLFGVGDADKNGRVLPFDEDTGTLAAGTFIESAARSAKTKRVQIRALQKLCNQPIKEADFALFAEAIYSSALAIAKKPIFIDKTPRYYHLLDFLDRAYPSSRKIVLKRNPLDVAVSYKSTWGVSIAELIGETATPNTVDFAKGLFELTRYGAGTRANMFCLKYEDLASEPEVWLRKICRFLDVPYSSSMLSFQDNSMLLGRQNDSLVGDRKVLQSGRSIDSFSIGKWREGLTFSEKGELSAFLGAGLFRSSGYSDVLGELKADGIVWPTERASKKLRVAALVSSRESGANQRKLGRWAYIATCTGADLEELEAMLNSLAKHSKPLALSQPIAEIVQNLVGRYKRSEDDRRARLLEIDKLKFALDALQIRTHSGDQNIQKLTDALQLASAERASQLSTIEEYRTALEVASTQISAQNVSIEDLTRALAAASAERAGHIDGIKALTSAFEEATAQIASRDASIELLTQGLRRATSASEAQLSQIGILRDALSKESTKTLSQSEDLDVLTTALRSAETTRASHAVAIDDLTQALAKTSIERETHQRAIAELTAALSQARDELRSRDTQIADFRAALEFATIKRDADGQSIAELTAALQAAGVKRDADARSVNDLTAALELAGTKREDHQRSIVELTGALETAATRRDKDAQSINELTEALISAGRKRDSDAQTIIGLVDALGAASLEHESHRKSISELTAALEIAGAKRDGDARDIGELTDALESAGFKRIDDARAIEDLDNALAAADARRAVDVRCIEELTDALANAGMVREMHERALSDLTSALTLAAVERENNLAVLNEYKEALVSARSKNAVLSDDVKQLTQALEVAGGTREAHELAIHELTSALIVADRERASHLEAIETLTSALTSSRADSELQRNNARVEQGNAMRLSQLLAQQSEDIHRANEFTRQAKEILARRAVRVAMVLHGLTPPIEVVENAGEADGLLGLRRGDNG